MSACAHPAYSWTHLLGHALLEQMNCLEPKDSKDDGAGIDGSEGVAAGDDAHILDTVLGRIVVGPKADD